MHVMPRRSALQGVLHVPRGGVLQAELRQRVCLQYGFVAQIAFAKDSLSESIVLSGGDEQLDTDDIQDPKLESV